jgi:hypothetical protein
MISPEKRWPAQRCKKPELPRTHGHRGCTNRSTGGQSRRQSPRPQRRHCRHRRRQPRRRICRRPPPPPAGGGGCKSGGIRADAAACRSRLSAFVCRIEFSEDPVILQCFSISLPKLSLATPSHSPPGPFSLFESLTAAVPRATGRAPGGPSVTQSKSRQACQCLRVSHGPGLRPRQQSDECFRVRVRRPPRHGRSRLGTQTPLAAAAAAAARPAPGRPDVGRLRVTQESAHSRLGSGSDSESYSGCQ